MKHFFKIIFAILFAGITFSSCDKADDLIVSSNGTAPVLTSSLASFAPAPADSLTKKVVFSWSDPKYASATANKYVIEIDSATKNFVNPQRITVTGVLKDSILTKDLNTMMLNLGFKFNVAGTAQVRIKSSYGNNNEMYISNVIPFTYTAYKIPPKVALPTTGKLYIVGNATQGDWNNPVPVPTQEFAQIDETTYGGVFQLNGAKEYLVLPLNGNWDHKFAVANATVPAEGGDFGYDQPTNFHSPATSGWYKIILNFQTGKYTVTPFTGVLPTNLFMVGDATPGEWNNPVPTPSQQLTRLNSSVWTITLPITANKEFLLLPVNGSWDHKYAAPDTNVPATGGAFGYDMPKNFKGPATGGNHTFTFNFATEKYTVQ